MGQMDVSQLRYNFPEIRQQKGGTDSRADGLVDSLPEMSVALDGEIPDFSAVTNGLGHVGSEERVLVIEIFHGRLVTAEDVKCLDGYIRPQRHEIPVNRMLSS
jgi:hypothetical protein